MGKRKTLGVVFLVSFLLFLVQIVLQGSEEEDAKLQVYSENTMLQFLEETPQFSDEIESTKNHCALDTGIYKAWKTGIVTSLGSPIIKDCYKIIAGDNLESTRVNNNLQKWLKTFKQQMYSNKAYHSLLQQSRNCSRLKGTLNNNLYNTKLERDFPIAYVFLVYESPLQFLRLFKILYKPQNSYCIHADRKSPFREFYDNIIKCFDNVIAPTKQFDVQWAKYTMLEAQVQCFTDLVNLREIQTEERKWKYVVNLCGKELPLHSTKEMVQMIQSMKGTSSIVTWPIPKTEWMTMKRFKRHTIPFNLTLYKSMAYNALSADFTTFMVTNFRARNLLRFFKDVVVPEEHFYSVLFHMPGVPGSYSPDIPDEGYFEVSHYFWRSNRAEKALPCFGSTIHMICIVTHSDLPRIMRETNNGDTSLFQNKYFMEKNHVVMDCMEEMIVAKNKLEYEEDCHV